MRSIHQENRVQFDGNFWKFGKFKWISIIMLSCLLKRVMKWIRLKREQNEHHQRCYTRQTMGLYIGRHRGQTGSLSDWQGTETYTLTYTHRKKNITQGCYTQEKEIPFICLQKLPRVGEFLISAGNLFQVLTPLQTMERLPNIVFLKGTRNLNGSLGLYCRLESSHSYCNPRTGIKP